MGIHDQLSFLSGIRSPMATLLREHAGEASLGPPEQWPAPLKSTVSLMLGSGFPMAVAWGPQLNMVYNEGYAEVLGANTRPAGASRSWRSGTRWTTRSGR